MGMYPPGTEVAVKLPESLTVDLGPANPPFKIRDAYKVAEELGQYPLLHEFTSIPVMSYEYASSNSL